MQLLTATSANLNAPMTPSLLAKSIYVIDPNSCTECVGHLDEPQCQQVCPVDCIPLDPERPETHEKLMEKYRIITAA